MVGLVLPWNFLFLMLMLAWKIGPALAAGCSVVVKPATETSLTALRVAEIAAESGLPRGVLNVVPGSGTGAGEPIGRHKDIDRRLIHRLDRDREALPDLLGRKQPPRSVVLEMGGKNLRPS